MRLGICCVILNSAAAFAAAPYWVESDNSWCLRIDERTACLPAEFSPYSVEEQSISFRDRLVGDRARLYVTFYSHGSVNLEEPFSLSEITKIDGVVVEVYKVETKDDYFSHIVETVLRLHDQAVFRITSSQPDKTEKLIRYLCDQWGCGDGR